MKKLLSRTDNSYKICYYPHCSLQAANCILMPVLLILMLLIKTEVFGQDLEVPYVPTPLIIVEKMLDLAEVKPGDYLIDLGSGDGRIVIAAAKRGAVAHGIDLNPIRIEEANKNAIDAEVDKKVLFIEDDIFKTDFSRADIVTMYLLNSVNLKLRPYLLEKLKPGTRIVSHDFDMGDWACDDFLYIDDSSIYKWIVPAKVSGKWSWDNGNNSFTMIINQEFQKIKVLLSSNNNNLIIYNSILSGDKIVITAENPLNGEHYLFNGRVDNNAIIGTVQIRNKNSNHIEQWNAKYI